MGHAKETQNTDPRYATAKRRYDRLRRTFHAGDALAGLGTAGIMLHFVSIAPHLASALSNALHTTAGLVGSTLCFIIGAVVTWVGRHRTHQALTSLAVIMALEVAAGTSQTDIGNNPSNS